MALEIRPQNILHYNNIKTINEVKINATVDPIVVLKSGTANSEQVEVRVVPFNATNSDKIALPFAERMQYYKKTLVKRVRAAASFNDRIIPADNTKVLDLVRNYFFSIDGWSKEYSEFVEGFNTPTLVASLKDFDSYFAFYYLELDNEVFNDFKQGMGIA